jgi:transcriptional regulator with XRE-family HTH domain
MAPSPNSRLFPALLRYWRTRRGLSQLDLSLEADVSTKHVSHLESGRARPSEEMVLRLLSVLNVPLHDQNEALATAGFEPHFPAPSVAGLPPEIEQALAQMMAQHEPFPLAILLLDGTVVRQNGGASRLFQYFVASPEALPDPIDMFSLLLDPRLMRPFIVDWEVLARSIVSRVHREHLLRGDARLEKALERIFASPGVPQTWRQPDFSANPPPTLRLNLSRGDLSVGFLVTVTAFSTPQQVTLDELRIESCFPVDAMTREACVRLAATA